MVRNLEHAQDLIAKRKANGRKNIPKAVRRWCRRTGQQIPDLLSDTAKVE